MIEFVQEFELKCRIGRAANDVNLAGMAKFVGSLRVPRARCVHLAFVLLGIATAACATANDQSIMPGGDDGSGGSDVSTGGTVSSAGSSDSTAGSFGTSGASSLIGGGAAGQSSGTAGVGSGGSTATFGGAGGGGAGASSSGGVSTFGGATTGGAASGGGAGTSTAGGSTGSTGGTAGATGTAGSGTAGNGTAGSSSSAGAAGATGGTGCSAPPWTAGFAYKTGDVVTGVCQNTGGGATVCVGGKKYPWTCFGPTCATYQPGADGWWGNWTVGTACN